MSVMIYFTQQQTMDGTMTNIKYTEWQTESGLKAQYCKGMAPRVLCGYIRIPKDHQLYGEYYQLDKSCYNDLPFEISYSGFETDDKGALTEEFYIGFFIRDTTYEGIREMCEELAKAVADMAYL